MEAIENFFGNADSCQRLMRVLCVETSEAWLESSRYLNMDLLIEHKKALLGKCGSSPQTAVTSRRTP